MNDVVSALAGTGGTHRVPGELTSRRGDAVTVLQAGGQPLAPAACFPLLCLTPGFQRARAGTARQLLEPVSRDGVRFGDFSENVSVVGKSPAQAKGWRWSWGLG